MSTFHPLPPPPNRFGKVTPICRRNAPGHLATVRFGYACSMVNGAPCRVIGSCANFRVLVGGNGPTEASLSVVRGRKLVRVTKTREVQQVSSGESKATGRDLEELAMRAQCRWGLADGTVANWSLVSCHGPAPVTGGWRQLRTAELVCGRSSSSACGPVRPCNDPVSVRPSRQLVPTARSGPRRDDLPLVPTPPETGADTTWDRCRHHLRLVPTPPETGADTT